MKYLLFFVIALTTYNCTDKDCGDISFCYSFDVRQCETDLFSAAVPTTDSADLQASKMKAWLSDQGVEVHKVSVEPTFHDAVCEACHVCPRGPRFFLKSSTTVSTERATELQLLNFSSADCEDL